jgi:secreted trypsin-like serine protease
MQGDSGGPLLVDNIQVGIVSWGYIMCGNPTFPDIFTRVTSYTQWIARKTGLNIF